MRARAPRSWPRLQQRTPKRQPRFWPSFESKVGRHDSAHEALARSPALVLDWRSSTSPAHFARSQYWHGRVPSPLLSKFGPRVLLLPFASREHHGARGVLGQRTPNLLIRRSGQIVQDRPSPVVGWADIPGLSTCVGCCPAAWLQSWLQSRRNGTDPRSAAFRAGHIPRWRGSYGCYALSPIAADSSWSLLLLSSLLSVRRRPYPSLSPMPVDGQRVPSHTWRLALRQPPQAC